MTLDATRRQVFWGDEEVKLSPREFELLLYLTNQPGRVYSRGEIESGVWGEDLPPSSNVRRSYRQYSRQAPRRWRLRRDPHRSRHRLRHQGVGALACATSWSPSADCPSNGVWPASPPWLSRCSAPSPQRRPSGWSGPVFVAIFSVACAPTPRPWPSSIGRAFRAMPRRRWPAPPGRHRAAVRPPWELPGGVAAGLSGP